jgi:DNA-binding transcriptional ArsR family regulator
MAYSKHSHFESGDAELSRFAAALAHPARIAILKALLDRTTCICGEIVEILPLAQSTVSQHLKALKNAGLIQGTVDGPRSCYCVNPKAVSRLTDMFHNFLGVMSKTKGKVNEKLRKKCR